MQNGPIYPNKYKKERLEELPCQSFPFLSLGHLLHSWLQLYVDCFLLIVVRTSHINWLAEVSPRLIAKALSMLGIFPTNGNEA